jgi:hypothetical protein
MGVFLMSWGHVDSVSPPRSVPALPIGTRVSSRRFAARASGLAGRNEIMDAMTAPLRWRGHLAVPVAQAQAMYRALAAPGVYRDFAEESGWSPEDFEHWAGDTSSAT